MKAWILKNNNDIRFEDIPIPEIGGNDVLVKVKAAGICGSDIPRIYNNGAYFYPLITGHEFSGQIEAVGINVDTKWQGKRVGVFPLIPCKECIPCRNENYEMCRKYNYLGSRCNGGFAEYVAVPKENLIELPDNVSFEQAAMLEPMAVAVHAIRKINIKSTDRIAVCGLGTIGILIVMLLIEQGIKEIYVIGNKDIQRETVLKLGIEEDNYCNANKTDVNQWLKDKSGNYGFDVFFECVGKNETVTQALDNSAPAGRVMLVGNPYGDMILNNSDYWKILRHQLTVMGTWNSSFTHDANDDWHYVLNKLENGRIAPEMIITHKYNFFELNKGLHLMRDKTEPYTKVMSVL